MAEGGADGGGRSDHEDQQQADDQRRSEQRQNHSGLPDPGKGKAAPGHQVGERGTQQQDDRQGNQRRRHRRHQGLHGARLVQGVPHGRRGEVAQQGDQRAEQGNPDDQRSEQGDAGADSHTGAAQRDRGWWIGQLLVVRSLMP